MRYLLAFTILMAIGCKSESEPIKIIDKSIAAHGGWETWNKLDSIHYVKDYNLYREDGSIEQSFHQIHSTNIFPIYKNRIVRTDSSELIFDGAGYFKSKGDSALQVSSGDTGLIHSSFYVLAQPFKLRDPGAKLTFEGIDTLFNGQEVLVIKVEYKEEGKENHPWWYYFDPVDFKLIANMVDHNGSFSLITNDEYVTHKGLLWHSKRTGYRTDSLGNILFKRSDYLYTYNK